MNMLRCKLCADTSKAQILLNRWLKNDENMASVVPELQVRCQTRVSLRTCCLVQQKQRTASRKGSWIQRTVMSRTSSI